MLILSKRFVSFSHLNSVICNVFKLKRLNHTYQGKEINILGIETSCDDTGAAVVNGSGQVLGEGFASQSKIVFNYGGVIPIVSKQYHERYLTDIVEKAIKESGIPLPELTAIAVTVKPGTLATLKVGAKFGKRLALRHNLPFIPIHHMEAHALTARMNAEVPFPFFTLLVSGGHCLFGFAEALDRWSVLGETVDISPGVAFDHVARRVKLKSLAWVRDSGLTGGAAVSAAAKRGDERRFEMPMPLGRSQQSDFAFGAFLSETNQRILNLEEKHGIVGSQVLDEVYDICASFQYGLVRHIVRRVHRAILFTSNMDQISAEGAKLVMSGGVASNSRLRQAMSRLCEELEIELVVPPPRLCTDNGVMVAWNGVERWREGLGVITDPQQIRDVEILKECPLGPSLGAEIRKMYQVRPRRYTVI